MRNHDQVEIRLLGPMLVRCADGRVVPPGDWRTAKTADLLRLLALNAGEPVRVDTIVELLWPDAEPERGRASMRTAAYQIRRVLGDEDCVRRVGNTLALERVWVDTHAYELLAGEVEEARRSGDHRRTVALTCEAESLYVGDVDADDSSSPWCEDARTRWRVMRTAVLVDAAESALALGWMRDALDFASRVRELDPSSERGARALMRALGGLGETEKALEVFERLRRELASHIGVDPSPHTRALHVQLLTGLVPPSVVTPLVPPAAAVRGLTEALARADSRRHAVAAGLHRRGDSLPGAHVVILHGPPGSGRGTVLEVACENLALPCTEARRGGAGRSRAGARRHDADVALPGVVALEATSILEEADLVRLCAEARLYPGTVVVPVDVMDAGIVAQASQLLTGHTLDLVELMPLDELELANLARSVLQGEPAPQLIELLRRESSGWAGLACAALRGWLADGRVAWTTEGMQLVEPHPAGARTGSRLGRLLRMLDWREIDALSVLAVTGAAVTLEELHATVQALHPSEALAVEELVDTLIDRGLVRVAAGGITMRGERDRNDLVDWLRPAVLRRIHQLVADTLELSGLERARHHVAAGAHQEACDVALDALSTALAEEDDAMAEKLVQLLDTLPDRMLPTSSTQPLRVHLQAVTSRASRACAMAVSAVSGPHLWELATRENGMVSTLAAIA